jgi:hypothetical protein
MKPVLFTLLLLGAFAANAFAVPQDPEESQDTTAVAPASFGDPEEFHGALSPYGEWLELRDGFYAWRPTHVQSSWRPYLNGHWAWTDYGWYWVSNEPFGWATFHYGRWYRDDYYGWIWIPDRTWGPAWVEWRYNDNYLGWAPLPPYATFGINMGIRFTNRWSAPYNYWNFVMYRHLTSPFLAREVMPLSDARRLMGVTRSGGRYDYDGSHIINRGVDRGFVERRGGYTRIPRTDVRESATIGERMVRDRDQERIEVYRPNRPYTGRSNERFESRTIDRATSLEFHRIERAPHEPTVISQPRTVDREQAISRQAVRPPQVRVQRSVPPALQRRIDAHNQNRAPLLRTEPPRPQQDRRAVLPDRTRPTSVDRKESARSSGGERRAAVQERSQREARPQNVSPQPKKEEKKESPRRESGRKRN